MNIEAWLNQKSTAVDASITCLALKDTRYFTQERNPMDVILVDNTSLPSQTLKVIWTTCPAKSDVYKQIQIKLHPSSPRHSIGRAGSLQAMGLCFTAGRDAMNIWLI